MSIRMVRQDGDEILRKKSKEVKEITDKVRELIEDMKETMKEHGGCGLAAVQVGVLKRIIIVSPKEEEMYVFVNPKIVKMSKELVGEMEGCLSVDGYRGKVERPKSIELEAFDENMKPIKLMAEDFFARIICHEVDHLEGILYTDKVIKGTLVKDKKEDEE